MKAHELKVVVSLHAKTSEYHQMEAKAAEKSAKEHSFNASVVYAEGDALVQQKQLLDLIQSAPSNRPDVIMVDPFGTGMVRVAQEAVKAGIGWVVLNRDVDYVPELRENTQVPVFAVTTNHLETGRIQARQVNALLPQGGMILYLQGAVGSPAAALRAQGMKEIKQASIELKTLNGNWMEETAYEAIGKWLQLPTYREGSVKVVVAQNDFMAMGARRAFMQVAHYAKHHAQSAVKFLGCDGLEACGLSWARKGWLKATVVCPPLAARAMDVLDGEVRQGMRAPAVTFTEPVSFPQITELKG